MHIRKIKPDDLPDIISMIREFAAFEGLTEYCEVTEDRLNAAIFGPTAMTEGFVVPIGATLAAYALFYPGFSSFRGEMGLHLEDLYIRQEFRGKGLGRLLLSAVARTAHERGFERIDLMVSDQNQNAKAFYRRLGAECNSGERHFKFSDKAFTELSRYSEDK